MPRRTQGGTYVCDDLRAAGLDVGKASGEARCYPEDLTVFDDPDHPLHEPRALWPLDPGFLEALRSGDVLPIVTARRNGEAEIQVCDGTRTTLHLRAINVERAAAGQKPLRALVRFFAGDDKAFLLKRLALNSCRLDDTAETLAHKFAQAEREGATHEEIAAARPGTTPRLVADLLRFPSLTAKVRRALVDRLPVECVSAFVGVPREEQDDVLAGVIAQLPEGAPVTPGKVRAAVRRVNGSGGGGGSNGAPKPRARPRAFLERWSKELEDRAAYGGRIEVDLRELLDFLRGGPLPKLPGSVVQSMAAAGLKEAKEIVEQDRPRDQGVA